MNENIHHLAYGGTRQPFNETWKRAAIASMYPASIQTS